jgi:hypothetical protein
MTTTTMHDGTFVWWYDAYTPPTAGQPEIDEDFVAMRTREMYSVMSPVLPLVLTTRASDVVDDIVHTAVYTEPLEGGHQRTQWTFVPLFNLDQRWCPSYDDFVAYLLANKPDAFVRTVMQSPITATVMLPSHNVKPHYTRIELWHVWYALEYAAYFSTYTDLRIVLQASAPVHLFIELAIPHNHAPTHEERVEFTSLVSLRLAAFIELLGGRSVELCRSVASHCVWLTSEPDPTLDREEPRGRYLVGHFPSIVFSDHARMHAFMGVFISHFLCGPVHNGIKALRLDISRMPDHVRQAGDRLLTRHLRLVEAIVHTLGDDRDVISLPLPFARAVSLPFADRSRFIDMDSVDRTSHVKPFWLQVIACCPNHLLTHGEGENRSRFYDIAPPTSGWRRSTLESTTTAEQMNKLRVAHFADWLPPPPMVRSSPSLSPTQRTSHEDDVMVDSRS